MKQALLYESHCHTPLCKHASGEPAEYADAAVARGLRGITFTCHAPLPGGFSASVRMSPDQFPLYVKMILETRERFAGKTDVRLGLESDFYPGVEPWLEQLHGSVPLSHVLGSVHHQIPEYRALMHPGSTHGYREVYFEQLALSDHSGGAVLFDLARHEGSQLASLHREALSPQQAEMTQLTVQTRTLDDFCAEHGVERIDLLKIDTEGHELRILDGARRMLAEKRIRALQFEFNEMNVASRSFLKDFIERLPGHHLFRLLPTGLLPVAPYSPFFFEVFGFQNIVALPREESARGGR
ncbi:MAG: FkbM family methyltransferase [Myxococcota bacterium]